MAEDTTFPPTSMEVPYPTDYVVGAIDQHGEAEQAVAALHDAGFKPDDVVLLHADQLLEQERIREQHRGFIGRIYAWVRETTSDEGLDARHLEREAYRGHSLVHVYTPQQEQVDRAYDILRAHGAHDIKHYGQWAVTDLR